VPLVWPQNHWDSFLQFGLKTGGDGFLWFGLKTGGDVTVSPCLASKLVMDFLVERQNQGGGRFPWFGAQN
jgi:hypothetical protein